MCVYLYMSDYNCVHIYNSLQQICTLIYVIILDYTYIYMSNFIYLYLFICTLI